MCIRDSGEVGRDQVEAAGQEDRDDMSGSDAVAAQDGCPRVDATVESAVGD